MKKVDILNYQQILATIHAVQAGDMSAEDAARKLSAEV